MEPEITTTTLRAPAKTLKYANVLEEYQDFEKNEESELQLFSRVYLRFNKKRDEVISNQMYSYFFLLENSQTPAKIVLRKYTALQTLIARSVVATTSLLLKIKKHYSQVF